LGGYRISAEQWAERVAMLRIGDQTTVLLSRRGKIIELPLRIAEPPQIDSTPSWNLIRADKPTEEQENRWKSWLAIPSDTSTK
jgi:hypothetical protein